MALLSLPLAATVCAGDDKMETDKKALMPIGGFVGGWKGAGSNKGDAQNAWMEESDWSWEFKKGVSSAITFTAPTGRYIKGGRIVPGEKTGHFLMTATLPDGKASEKYDGEVNKEGELVLTNAAPADGRPARVTFSLVAKGKRLVMLYQRRERKELFAPIAEVGLTLKGSGFGKNFDAKECCITGGSPKIAVGYKGETYYVCCGGCKDAFDENPEKEIAAYKKRKEEEKNKAMAK